MQANAFVRELQTLTDQGLTEQDFQSLCRRFPHTKEGDRLIFRDGSEVVYLWGSHRFEAVQQAAA